MLAKNLYPLEVQDACKALRSKAKVRYLVVEREKITSQHADPEEVLDNCGGAKIGEVVSGGCGVATTGEAERRPSGDIHSCRDLHYGEISSQVVRGITCIHTSRWEVGRCEAIVSRRLK